MEEATLEIEVAQDRFVWLRCKRCTEGLVSGGNGNEISGDELRDAVEHVETCEYAEDDE